MLLLLLDFYYGLDIDIGEEDKKEFDCRWNCYAELFKRQL